MENKEKAGEIISGKRRKNLRLHLKEGDLIRVSDNGIYEVLFIGKEDFQCRNISLIGSDTETIQRFHYTIEMIIYREYARNVPS